ncbi:MAG TPA: DUF4136 domain-containing protein [Gammaproteobacteria bacterium]|nr:DUF4136 domain-containing protein [Gammaproteobacteria bacterium]
MFIRKTTRLLAALSILSFAGCSSVKSSYDYDSSFNFSTVKTWQWNKEPSAEFSASNPLIHARIVKAIEGALKQKRLRLETYPETPADVNVSYTIRLEKKLSSSGISTGIGMSVGGSSSRGLISLSSGNQLKQTTEGTLVIDVTSIPSGTLLWRGTATGGVSLASASPEESQAKINKAVDELFKNFPPPVRTN